MTDLEHAEVLRTSAYRPSVWAADRNAMLAGAEAIEQAEMLIAAARVFERERDEARAELEQLKKDWTAEHLKVATLQEGIDASREREKGLRDGLVALVGEIDAIRKELGTNYPALAEAWGRAQMTLAESTGETKT